MNKSHNQKEEVPAHRVVNKKGLLTGKHHFDGTNLMQQLLENEGVVVIENQIQNLEEVFYNSKRRVKNSNFYTQMKRLLTNNLCLPRIGRQR